jgi:ankyrin repeat protein
MSNQLRSLDRITIPKPCDADWDSMVGNDQVRFCEHCNLHVNNLSNMTRLDAMRLVARSKGRLCVRYIKTLDGGVLSKGVPEKLHRISRRVSRIAAGAFTATLSLTSAAAQGGSGQQPGALRQEPAVATATSQEPGAILSGVITDPNGAVVSGATLTLTNTKTNLAFTYTTGDDGVYKFSLLEAGQYNLVIEASSFVTREIPELNLRPNSNRAVNLSMEIPELTVQVEINAEPITVVEGGIGGAVAFVEPEDPLVRAVFKEDLDAVKQLVFSSLDINARDKATHMTAMEQAAEKGNLEIVRTLVLAGASADLKSDTGRTPLMYLGDNATADLVRELLSAGAKVNAHDEDGSTPLMNAASTSNYAAVKTLIEGGAKVDLKDTAGKTALLFAAKNEDPRVTKLLIDAGADVSSKDNEGKTALMIAADEGDPETLKLLISYDARINETDYNGWSALMFAASVRDAESVIALLNAGADTTFKDKDGKTALALARENDAKEVVKILESRGAPE